MASIEMVLGIPVGLLTGFCFFSAARLADQLPDKRGLKGWSNRLAGLGIFTLYYLGSAGAFVVTIGFADSRALYLNIWVVGLFWGMLTHVLYSLIVTR